MSSPQHVAASYRAVRRLSRRSGSNFYRSFWLLPRPKRDAMCALYAFARVTDDLGDCDEPSSIKALWLDWWRRTTALNLIGEDEIDAVVLPDNLDDVAGGQDRLGDGGRLRRAAMEILPALRDASVRYSIPSRYLLEIIDGVLADQQKTRFDTYEQVEHYCYLVASAVGLACAHIWEFEDELPLTAAIDCGLAFQWTNILRDIAEDAGRGRIYMPRQHYERHGLTEDDVLQLRSDNRLACLIAEEVRRAEALFVSGWGVHDALHRDGRPMFSMMWRTYRMLLTHIADDPTAVMRRRIRLKPREKMDARGQPFLPTRIGTIAHAAGRSCGSTAYSGRGGETSIATQMNAADAFRVAIVGGGLAGLAAAELLARQPSDRFEITVLERKRVAGGRAGSFAEDDADGLNRRDVDYCQHVAMGCCEQFLALLSRCGLSDCLHRYDELVFTHPDHPPSRFRPSRWMPPPLHLAPTLVGMNYLNARQKWRLARALLRLIRTPADSILETTSADWLAENGQDRKTIECFWIPVLVSALGETIESASMAASRKVIVDGFAARRGASDVYVPAVPLSQLIGETLVAAVTQLGVRVRTGCGVKNIRRGRDQTRLGPAFELEFNTNDSDRRRTTPADRDHVPPETQFDAVIVAVPWHRWASVIDPSLHDSIDQLDAISKVPASPITGLHLWLDRPVLRRPHVVSLGTTAQWFFRDPVQQDGKNAGEHGEHKGDEHYVQAVVSASRDLRDLDRAAVVKRVVEELRALDPSVVHGDAADARLLRSKVVTDPRSVYSLTPQTARLRPPPRTAVTGLILASDFVQTGWPATMEGGGDQRSQCGHDRDRGSRSPVCHAAKMIFGQANPAVPDRKRGPTDRTRVHFDRRLGLPFGSNTHRISMATLPMVSATGPSGRRSRQIRAVLDASCVAGR